VALQLYSQIAAQSAQSHLVDGDLSRRALECSRDIAIVALGQILAILTLADNERFETEVHPPSKFRDQLMALLNRGPAKLDRYHYIYGLLDCASQLGTISGPEKYPKGLEVRMRSIIARSTETTFRWKAVSGSILQL
jgi:hypothetical protein